MSELSFSYNQASPQAPGMFEEVLGQRKEDAGSTPLRWGFYVPDGPELAGVDAGRGG